MTIEQLLDLPTDELGRLSDADLDRILQPYLPFTRPARARATTTLKVAGADDLLAKALAGELVDPNQPPKRKLKF